MRSGDQLYSNVAWLDLDSGEPGSSNEGFLEFVRIELHACRLVWLTSGVEPRRTSVSSAPTAPTPCWAAASLGPAGVWPVLAAASTGMTPWAWSPPGPRPPTPQRWSRRRCRVRARSARGVFAPPRRWDLGESWFWLHQLFWRTDDRRHQPGCPNRLLDLATHRRVRKMAKIPSQQVVDPVDRRNPNVHRVDFSPL